SRAYAGSAPVFRSAAAPGPCTLGPVRSPSAPSTPSALRPGAQHSCSSRPPTMPAGVPMSTYVKMLAASLLAMCAGAEVVHRYYRPDLAIPEIPPKRGELKTELLGLKERKHKPQVSQQEELK
ncbi:protein C12orf73-like protein, partial [Plecturocebus cupreus]